MEEQNAKIFSTYSTLNGCMIIALPKYCQSIQDDALLMGQSKYYMATQLNIISYLKNWLALARSNTLLSSTRLIIDFDSSFYNSLSLELTPDLLS
jgi:hypothetical protein